MLNVAAVATPATPLGDTEIQAGRGFQPVVASVADARGAARVAWQGWNENSPKSVKDYLVDLAVYRAFRHEVPGPCPTCGGEVFHRAGHGAPWRCRKCEPAMGRVQWLAIGEGPIGRALRRERPSGACPRCREMAPEGLLAVDGTAMCAHCAAKSETERSWQR